MHQLIKDTQASVSMLAAAAKATPADKLSWSPGGKARPALEFLRECAGFADFMLQTIKTGQVAADAFSPEMSERARKEMPDLPSILNVLTQSTQIYCEFMKQFPKDQLQNEIAFPWGTYTVEAAFGFHYWNNTYHLGQLNYIQLLFGDTEMHV